jgi:hypothetical protein
MMNNEGKAWQGKNKTKWKNANLLI